MVDREREVDVSVLDSTALFRGVLYGIWTKWSDPKGPVGPFSQKSEEMTGKNVRKLEAG